jgi:hypothetical protein
MFDYERRYLPNKKLSLDQNELLINETKKIVDFIKAEKRIIVGRARNTTHTGEAVNWQQLIKPELQAQRLPEIEDKVKNKIANWKKRDDLIECAAFCELLYDKLYFNIELKLKDQLNRKAINSFALSKYGTDIKAQLQGGEKKKARNNHKKLLSKYFS